MARTLGPLLSLGASGSVAGALTFATWKGRPYVRQLVIPANPKSVKQLAVRAMMKFLSQNYDDAVVDGFGSEWDAVGAQDAISGFNAFVRANLRAWAQFIPPTEEPDIYDVASPDAQTAATATAGIKSATVHVAVAANTNTWGAMFFRELGAAVTPSPQNLVAAVTMHGVPVADFVDSPLTAGTWHYKVRLFTPLGKMGTASADLTAVVA